MKNQNELIRTIKDNLSIETSNPTGQAYKANDLLAVFSTDYTFVIAYTEVEEPRYSSWKFNLRGVYGNSIIDTAKDPIHPDYMKRSLRWYQGFTTSYVTLKTYLAVDVSELVPSHFLHRGMIYDGDLLKLHHEVMHLLSMQPEMIDFIGASIIGIKKTALFTSIYDTIGHLPAIPRWPQIPGGILGFTSMKSYSPKENELEVSSVLGLFHQNGQFEFVTTEYGHKTNYNAPLQYREQSFWYLCNAFNQRIIARDEVENVPKPTCFPLWCEEKIYQHLGMTIAASKVIPPQILRCGDFISVDNLKRIENSINCLLEDRPELLEPYFPKSVRHNLFDVLRKNSVVSGSQMDSYSKEIAFYQQMLKEAEALHEGDSIRYWNDRIKEAQKRKGFAITPLK